MKSCLEYPAFVIWLKISMSFFGKKKNPHFHNESIIEINLYKTYYSHPEIMYR